MPDKDGPPRTLPDPETWDEGALADAPPPDELFGMLANTDRRRTLWFLLDTRRTTIDEVADTLLGWRISEGGIAGPEERRRILQSLHHTHIPMLEKGGLLTYDTDGGEIRRSSLAEPVRDAIRFGCRYERAAAAADSE